MKKVPLWCRGIVVVVEASRSLDISDNNQFSEAVFRNPKYNQDIYNNISEPALCRWNHGEKSDKLFIKQLDQLDDESVYVVQKNRVAKASRKKPPPSLTQDAFAQQEEEDEDEQWDRRGASKETDTALQLELKELFGVKTNKRAHESIQDCFAGDKSKIVMCYSTFNTFMKGERKKALKPKNRDFLSEYIAKQNKSGQEEIIMK
jgi:hypothetical protein